MGLPLMGKIRNKQSFRPAFSVNFSVNIAGTTHPLRNGSVTPHTI